jgi:hypothetical protein
VQIIHFSPETMVRLDLHSLPRSASIPGVVRCISFLMASNVPQIFTKYNKNYQNVNSKRLQLATVYFLTLNDHLACAISDFVITSLTSESLDTPTTNDSLHTTVVPLKYWIIISLFRFFRGFI